MKKKLTLNEEVTRMKKIMGLLNENEMMDSNPGDLFGSGGSFPTDESEGFKQWCDENGVVEVGPDMYTMGDDREYTKDEMMQMYSDSEYAAKGVDSDVERDIERGYASDEPKMFEMSGYEPDYPSDFDYEGDSMSYSSSFFDDEVEEFDDEKFNDWLMNDKNAVQVGPYEFRVDGETYTEEQLMDMFTKEMGEPDADGRDYDSYNSYDEYPENDNFDMFEQKKNFAQKKRT